VASSPRTTTTGLPAAPDAQISSLAGLAALLDADTF
jgi:hypothetical protein